MIPVLFEHVVRIPLKLDGQSTAVQFGLEYAHVDYLVSLVPLFPIQKAWMSSLSDAIRETITSCG